jgi:RNase P/RNase MRP subunit p29
MSWINSLFNRNRTETIEVELLDETDKSIKIKYGIHTTYLPKKIITFMRVNEGSIIKVRLPLWLYRKTFN